MTVVLRHHESGDSIESEPTCSGEVSGGDTATRPVMFVERTPRDLCGRVMERACDMEIIPLDRERSVASAPPNAARPVLPGDRLDEGARSVLGAASADIGRCLRSGEPVTVHITVAPAGAVEDVRAESGAGTNTCVERVVHGLTFAPRDARTRYVVDLGARDPGEGR